MEQRNTLVTAAILALVGIACAGDLIVGEIGKSIVIFHKNYNGNGNGTHIDIITNRTITAIKATDLNKNGTATLVSGGVGHQNVTLGLLSPKNGTGYNFDIDLYGNGAVTKGVQSLLILFTSALAMQQFLYFI